MSTDAPVRVLYRASRVRTLSRPATGEWLLVDGRHVQRVGSGPPPEADRVVELPGATILPGFVDAHVHLTGTGLSMVGLPIERARSAEDLLGLVAEELTHAPTRIFAHGFDESTWPTRRLPALPELDALSDVPIVLVRADGHISLANTPALAASGVLRHDGVERDADGRPTGVLVGEANAHAQRWFHESLTDHDLRELQLEAAALAASRGVTCVHEMAIPAQRGRREVEVLLGHRERLPLDVVVYVADTEIPWLVDLGIETMGGDLNVDGSIGARTAAVAGAYVDADGDGVLYQDAEMLTEVFHNAHLAGMQIGVHAIGDRAIAQILSVWERIHASLDSRGRRHFRARRHRIEHFEMAGPAEVERAAILGLAISVQPAFDAAWGHPGGLYEQRLGEERAARMNPFGTMLGRGLEVGAGSDSPITDLDPIAGILALERHHDPAQRITREEAVHLFTVGAARLANDEGKKGSLHPGAHADFAAYDEDLLTAADPTGIRPILTVSRGREVFAR